MLKASLALTVVLVSLTIAPDSHAVGWGAPTEVGPRAGVSQAEEPRVALNAAGDAVHAWYRRVSGGVEGRLVTAAGASPVARHGQTSGLPYNRPFEKVLVAMSPSRGGVVAWIDFDPASRELTGRAVVARPVSAGGMFGDPIVVSAPGAAPRDLQAGVDDAGGAILAWTDGDGDRVQARRLTADGVLGPLVPLAGAGGVVRLVADASGNAIVGWWRQDVSRVETRVIRSDGSVGPMRSLGRVRTADFSLAVDRSSGSGAVAFVQQRRGGDRLYSRPISTSGRLGGRRLITRREADAPVVAVDARGRALIAWWGEAGRRRQGVLVRSMRPSGALGRARLIRRASDLLGPEIAANARGQGLVSFYDYDGTVSVVPVSTTGKVGQRRRFRNANNDGSRRTSLAVTPDGTAVVTWLGQASHTVVAVRGRL